MPKYQVEIIEKRTRIIRYLIDAPSDVHARRVALRDDVEPFESMVSDCTAKVGLSKMVEPVASVRVEAKFVPQAFIDGEPVDIDGCYMFDVTDLLPGESAEDLAIKDNEDSSRMLWLAWSDRHPSPSRFLGPFRVEVQDAIRAYYDKKFEFSNALEAEKKL